MTGQGWVTGSDIVSRPPTKEYREGWERIFGKKKSDHIPAASLLHPDTIRRCNIKIDNGDRPQERD